MVLQNLFPCFYSFHKISVFLDWCHHLSVFNASHSRADFFSCYYHSYLPYSASLSCFSWCESLCWTHLDNLHIIKPVWLSHLLSSINSNYFLLCWVVISSQVLWIGMWKSSEDIYSTSVNLCFKPWAVLHRTSFSSRSQCESDFLRSVSELVLDDLNRKVVSSSVPLSKPHCVILRWKQPQVIAHFYIWLYIFQLH